MTRFITTALYDRQPDIAAKLRSLERSNLHPSEDIKLTLEINQKTKDKIVELGLDPNDTTGEELYRALVQKIYKDDDHLNKVLRSLAAHNVAADGYLNDGIVQAITRCGINLSGFLLSDTKLRSMIRRQPPKKTMRALGYRSTESFIKRNDIELILAAAMLCESPNWHFRLTEQLKNLKASDFESRNIKLLTPKSETWKKLIREHGSQVKSYVLPSYISSSIVLLPTDKVNTPGASIAGLYSVLEAINAIKIRSSFLSTNRFDKDFALKFKRIIKQTPGFKLDGIDIILPWELLREVGGSDQAISRINQADPFYEQEEIGWQNIEKYILKIDDSLSFWSGSSHLALQDNLKTVPLNIMDNAVNLLNNLPYALNSTKVFQKELWHAILSRYISHSENQATDSQSKVNIGTSS